MSFLFPLGLLGLIAIPVLIAIYIIKNKYTEQLVSSTYLWTLSERFLKRKNPINRLTGILSLILQILAVIFISLAIAHPIFVLPGAANDYCFILDGSGSMNMMQGNRTRFDIAKEEIETRITESADASTFTLIFAQDVANVVYEGVTDKTQALNLLAQLKVGYETASNASAIITAQKYFDDNRATQTVFVTDKEYELHENVEIVNVSAHEENYAVSNLDYAIRGGKLVVSGMAFSYEADAEVTLEAYYGVDETPSATQTVSLVKGEGAEFSFELANIDFSSVCVRIANTDALMLDNEAIVYNVRSDVTFQTLIVSDTPFFFQSALVAMGVTAPTVVSPKEYSDSENSNYGLYIYDSYVPSVLPRNGAVWFVNPTTSVANSGFSVQGEETLGNPALAVFSTSSSTKVRNLLKGTVKDEIYVTRYMKCGFNRSFITLLSQGGNPLLFAGSNGYGNREVVFAFKPYNSDFTVSIDFVTLVNNLLNYTFPSLIDDSSYFCGETASVNVLPNCESIRVDSPNGSVQYLVTNNTLSEFNVTEAGVYRITMLVGGVARTADIYAELPMTERFTTVTEQTFSLNGEASSEKRDGEYTEIFYLFIVLAVIVIADWMVYCYEQYQLR